MIPAGQAFTQEEQATHRLLKWEWLMKEKTEGEEESGKSLRIPREAEEGPAGGSREREGVEPVVWLPCRSSRKDRVAGQGQVSRSKEKLWLLPGPSTEEPGPFDSPAEDAGKKSAFARQEKGEKR